MELGKLYWEIAKNITGKKKFSKKDRLPNIILKKENDILILEIPPEYEDKLNDIKSVLKNYKHKIVLLPKPTPNIENVVYNICLLLKSKNITNKVIDDFIQIYQEQMTK